MVRYRIYCEGQVQGVGFRYFVSRSAGRLGLAGFVRNLDDGRVEIEVQGTYEQLAEFLAAIRRGNGFSEISNLTIAHIEVIPAERAFRIAFDY